MPQKIYEGSRDPDGKLKVTVNGKPLRHVIYHSPDGYECGYEGSGPADLALSILANAFGERPTQQQLRRGDCRCWKLHQFFKRDKIATLPQDKAWKITGQEIAAWLRTGAAPGLQLQEDQGN